MTRSEGASQGDQLHSGDDLIHLDTSSELLWNIRFRLATGFSLDRHVISKLSRKKVVEREGVET